MPHRMEQGKGIYLPKSQSGDRVVQGASLGQPLADTPLRGVLSQPSHPGWALMP